MVWWAPLIAGLAGAAQDRQQGGSGQDALLSTGADALLPGAGSAIGAAKSAQAGNPLPLASLGLGAAGLDTASDVVGAASNPLGALAGKAGEAITGPGSAPGADSGAPVSFEQEAGAPDGTGHYVYADGSKKFVAGEAGSQLYNELVGTGKVTKGEAEARTPRQPATTADVAANAAQLQQQAATAKSPIDDVAPQDDEERALFASQGAKEDAARRVAEAQIAAQQQQAARVQQLVDERLAQTAAEEMAGRTQAVQAQEDQKWAEERVKALVDEKIDPLRLWNDAGFFGKAFSALLLLTAEPHNLRILMPFVSGLIQGDISAQKFDKQSQLNAYQGLLGDARAAEKAGELKRVTALRDQFDAKLKGADAATQQNADLVRAELDKQIAQGQQDLLKLTFDGRRQKRAAEETAKYRQHQMRMDEQRLGLDRQRLAMSKIQGSPSASKTLKEIEAKLKLAEIGDTGRSPERNKEIRQEAATLTDKLTPILGVQAALDEVFQAANIHRDENGKLVEPDDIPGKGPGEAWPVVGGVVTALKGNRQAAITLEAALKNAKEALGRAQSGGAITPEEVKLYSEILDSSFFEEDFVNKIGQFEKFLRSRAEGVKSRASDDALQEWLRRTKRPAEKPAGFRTLDAGEDAKIGPTGALDPREESRKLYEQLYGIPV